MKLIVHNEILFDRLNLFRVCWQSQWLFQATLQVLLISLALRTRFFMEQPCWPSLWCGFLKRINQDPLKYDAHAVHYIFKCFFDGHCYFLIRIRFRSSSRVLLWSFPFIWSSDPSFPIRKWHTFMPSFLFLQDLYFTSHLFIIKKFFQEWVRKFNQFHQK